MSKLPGYFEFKKYPRTPLRQLFSAASDDALDLLERMFIYDPQRRITALDALKHPYFKNQPLPADPKNMPRVVKPTEVPADGKKRKPEKQDGRGKNKAAK